MGAPVNNLVITRFRNWLCEVKKEQQWSFTDMAVRIGVDRSTLLRWLKGTRVPETQARRRAAFMLRRPGGGLGAIEVALRRYTKKELPEFERRVWLSFQLFTWFKAHGIPTAVGYDSKDQVVLTVQVSILGAFELVLLPSKTPNACDFLLRRAAGDRASLLSGELTSLSFQAALAHMKHCNVMMGIDQMAQRRKQIEERAFNFHQEKGRGKSKR